MAILTKQSREKLKIILSKQTGENLSDAELDEAYQNLMEFAWALVDLEPSEEADDLQLTKSTINRKTFIVN